MSLPPAHLQQGGCSLQTGAVSSGTGNFQSLISEGTLSPQPSSTASLLPATQGLGQILARDLDHMVGAGCGGCRMWWVPHHQLASKAPRELETD